MVVALAWLLASLPLAATVSAAELIVDNSDGVVGVKGKWTSTSTTDGFYGSDYLFRTPGDGSSSVTWPFPNGAAGRYEIFARWSAGPNRATNATYRVNSNAGAADVSVNQKNNGGSWQSLGSFDFQPGKGQNIVLTDKADGVVAADAIRFVGPANAPGLAADSLAFAQAQPSAPAAPQPQAAPAPADARYFGQTGYRVGDDAFWNYFQVRGGVRSFGYPVSN